MSRSPQRHAVVIGASMAGLATARVLADHFDRVTVLDRDQLPTDAQSRRGVPQGRHGHVLLAGGAKVIAELFPNIMEDLVVGGAGLVDFNEGSWHQAGGYRAASLVERKVVSASRPFLEGTVRRRVAALANVDVLSNTVVEGLVFNAERVAGVRISADAGARVLDADLVVDCSGRSSRASTWLAEIGYPAPDVVHVRCDVRYATVTIPRNAADLDGTFAVIIESPPHGKRAGFVLPIEGDRWIVTMASSFGTEAPSDEDSFRAIAAGLPSPEIRDVLERAAHLGPVATHRFVSSQRRQYERLKRVPVGFVALGDSLCSFNPVYGQGMSSGVLQAVALAECVARYGNDHRLGRAFYKRAAEVIRSPWQIAVGADFAYPECRGPKPRGVDVINRYMARVLVAAQVSAEVNTAMILVQSLLAPPATLFRPSMMRTVRRAAREADRRIASGAASERRRVLTRD